MRCHLFYVMTLRKMASKFWNHCGDDQKSTALQDLVGPCAYRFEESGPQSARVDPRDSPRGAHLWHQNACDMTEFIYSKDKDAAPVSHDLA
jgi:hypothetical protein